ncbi:alpha/beta hydrolase [Rhodanobacter sp. B05]|uniref:alpha/beta hydrolase n=1 Tax=Rhodanobacter sp. B05 TaxID=1945859 RepID=UPI0020C3C8D2|nr:alpha/beta hydrolase [Rhodanobacter sp. B05]
MPTLRQPRLHRCLACVLAAGAMLLLGGCRTMLFGALNSTDQHKDIQVERSLPYAPAQHLSLDVYLPAHVQHAPVVVFFYGGDWTHGKREWYRFVGTALAAKGVIVVIPDYRKYPHVGLDGFMQDAAHAVAWAHQHAASLGGDPQSLFVMGHSSGAQIAGLLATDPSWLAADGLSLHDLAGFVGLAGVYDFVPLPKKEADMRHLFGTQASEQRRADPMTFVRGNDPPMLLLQGTADREVRAAGSVALARKAHAVHDDAEARLYPGIGHMDLLLALSRPMRHHAPTLSDVLAFIRAHERNTPPRVASQSTMHVNTVNPMEAGDVGG